jgi:hypothetical protein
MPDHAGAFVDAVQTTALIVMAAAQIYTMLLLRNEMRAAADALSRVLDGQAETTASIERVWSHIHMLEVKTGLHADDNGLRPPQ